MSISGSSSAYQPRLLSVMLNYTKFRKNVKIILDKMHVMSYNLPMRIKTGRIVIVDLECTCWENDIPIGQQTETIEIGICIYNCIDKTITDKNSFYVMPKSEISEYCTNLTGITYEKLKAEGRPLLEVINTIKKKYPLKSCMWASWGDWDRKQMRKECEIKGIAYPFVDSHLNIKNLYAIMKCKSVGIGVSAALAELGFEFVGTPHCGGDDAYNEAVILRSLISPER